MLYITNLFSILKCVLWFDNHDFGSYMMLNINSLPEGIKYSRKLKNRVIYEYMFIKVVFYLDFSCSQWFWFPGHINLRRQGIFSELPALASFCFKFIFIILFCFCSADCDAFTVTWISDKHCYNTHLAMLEKN